MKKLLKLAGGVLLASVLAMGLSICSAFAQDEYEPITGNFTIPVKTTLDLKGAPVYPSHTVNYEVEDGKTYASSGPGAPVTASASSVNKIMYSFSGTSSEVEKSGSSFDFSNVTFTKPGLYKFPIKNTNTNGSSSIYVTSKAGSETQYYVYVQVDNVTTAAGQSALQIAGYKLVKGSSVQEPNGTPDESAKVAEALFENEFLQKTISIRKETTGNQGDKAREFEIGVKLGGVAYTYKYNISLVSGTPKAGTTAITVSNPYQATASGWTTVKLKDGDEVLVTGVPKDAEIQVQETLFGQDGYTSKSSVDDAAPTSTNEFVVPVADTADHSIVYINDKQGAIPTGLFTNNWPYIAIAFVALIVAAVVVRRKRNRYSDEDL